MNSLEFIAFTIEHWPTLIFWSIVVMFFLFLFFKNVTPVKIYDPFHFYVTFNLGTGYAVLISLYQHGHISHFLFFSMFFFAVILVISLHYFLKYPPNISKSYFKFVFSPVRNGKIEFLIVMGIYILFAILIIGFSGLGALSNSERFENARGVGMFIRVLDFFRLIILAYIAIKIVGIKKWTLIKISLYAFAIFFLIFSSMLGGAKFALLEGLFVISIALSKITGRLKISFLKAGFLLAFSTLFAILVIALGNKNNSEQEGIYNDNTNVVVQKLVARILANGDSYYGALPNNIIDKIETDALWVRFLSPLIGVSQTSKIVGYPVENYSVGRAILIYYDPGNDVSGGPVSHYDLFAYVYFGLFGGVFIIVLAYIIARVAASLNESRNIYYLSVVSALWARCLAMLLEPTVGLAYICDAFILISMIKIISLSIYSTSK